MEEQQKINHKHPLVLAAALLVALAVLLYFVSGVVLSPPAVPNTTTSYTTTVHGSSSGSESQNTSTIIVTTTVAYHAPPNISKGAEYSTNQTIEYTLSLINQVRLQSGLQSVTLSNETSAQQHSDSMIDNDFFSHWDIYGMKPYMRYTLSGGLGAVDENVAYKKYVQETCFGSSCNFSQINVTQAIYDMEYQMLYNDSICCNNGHRMNILDPNHNEVSIGVAYNRTSVYLTEDFVNNYVSWVNGTPIMSGSNVSLKGYTQYGSGLAAVQIGYEKLPAIMSLAQLGNTTSYSYGNTIAGVTYGKYYYPDIATIYGSTYYTNKNYFEVDFNMSEVERQNGPGAYTIMIYLDNSIGGEFLGASKTFFVNQSYLPFTPKNV